MVYENFSFMHHKIFMYNSNYYKYTLIFIGAVKTVKKVKIIINIFF